MKAKPREFWIRRFEVDELLNSDYKFSQADIAKSVPYPEHETESDYKDAYHVVEISALDAVNEEIKALREALNNTRHQVVGFKGNAEILTDIDEALKQSKERWGEL